MIEVTATVMLTMANMTTSFAPAPLCAPDIVWHTDKQEIVREITKYAEETGRFATGLAIQRGSKCHVYVSWPETKRDHERVAHEYRHCISGSYHK